jgi:hypothetical protein
MSVPLGLRRAKAMRSAVSGSSVRKWSAMAQPTTRREKQSMIVDRYNQPSQVRM